MGQEQVSTIGTKKGGTIGNKKRRGTDGTIGLQYQRHHRNKKKKPNNSFDDYL